MSNERIEKLRAQKEALATRIRREEAKVRTRERKDDTRRKILAGAAVLDEAEQKPEFNAQLVKLLSRFLSRPDDRALFGLPALPQAPQKPEVVQRGTTEELPDMVLPYAGDASTGQRAV